MLALCFFLPCHCLFVIFFVALVEDALVVKLLMKFRCCVLGVVIGFGWMDFEFCHK